MALKLVKYYLFKGLNLTLVYKFMNSTVKLITYKTCHKEYWVYFYWGNKSKDTVVNDLLIWHVFQKIHKEIKKSFILGEIIRQVKMKII